MTDTLQVKLPQEPQTESDTVSERVRRYVLEKSKTLAEIHKVTGVPKTTLGAWLRGEKSITTTVFDKICHAYKISPVRLYDVPEPGRSVPTLKELSTFGEGEKAVLLASIHEAVEKAKKAEQTTRDQIAGELRKAAEIMKSSSLMEKYFYYELEKYRPILEDEFNNLMKRPEFREEMSRIEKVVVNGSD